MNEFDVIVVGGGPAGSAATLFASRAGLKTLLLEKAVFPRDKTCGDAISGKSLNILRKLNLIEDIENIPQLPTSGVLFSSPGGDSVSVKFRGAKSGKYVSGYVCRRMDFDNYLFQHAKSEASLCLEGFQPTRLLQSENGAVGVVGVDRESAAEKTFRAKIIIGADGYKSFVSRQLGMYHFDSNHTLVAIRAYYEGVTETNDFIEIHYVKKALPGYFWIFPLSDGSANVGMGMRHSDIKKYKIDLYKRMDEVIDSDLFRHRFKNASPINKIKGWNLPVGSIFRPNYADHILLTGDAAGLIDPFTGEGIGNALTSAWFAVEVIKTAFEKNDFSKYTLSHYDKLLKTELENELKLSYQLQRMLIKYPFLINFIIKKASRNKEVEEWLSSMVADEVPKKTLTKFSTYLKLLKA